MGVIIPEVSSLSGKLSTELSDELLDELPNELLDELLDGRLLSSDWRAIMSAISGAARAYRP